jgi:hypothetical protein
MHLLVLPVSGNKFPVQMGLLSVLLDENYDPDIIFGNSGGAVTAITALGGDWSSSGIERLCRHLRPELFLQNWWPNSLSFIPSWSLGFFRGSVFNSNEELLDKFFETYLSTELLEQKELWIGASNESKVRPELFCNLSEEKSQVDREVFIRCCQRDGHWREDSIHYLDGNLRNMRIVTLSSASIPTLVPPQKYGDSNYSDGGVYHASPLSPMKSYLQHRANRESSFHITYINTTDIEDANTGSSVDFYPGIFRTGALTFANMISSLLCKDRDIGLNLILDKTYKLNKISLRGNRYILKKILDFRENKCSRSFLELYTPNSSSIDLQSFKPEDVLEVIKETKEEYRCRFWWIGDNKFIL